MIDGYHRLGREEQLTYLQKKTGIELSNLPTNEQHQQQIENYLTDFVVPEGIAVNFLVNNQEYVVPMVTEEPSVIAAASHGAKLVYTAGGFTANSNRLMKGQLLLTTSSGEKLKEFIKQEQRRLINIANAARPSMQKRGGGAKQLTVRPLSDTQYSIDLTVDTKEAMGANTINTMLEALKTYFESQNWDIDMAILSNLSDLAVTKVECRIPTSQLTKAVAKKIVAASNYAQIDPYRAATHNKGIMNGVDAVVMATGNDWRAIESGAHAFAAQDGQYRGLSTWKIVEDDLVGQLRLPLPVATIGGSIGINQQAQLNLKLLGVNNANELAMIIGSVGLAQNLAALLAIVTDGIQQGHMRLQAKSLLMEQGITPNDLEQAVFKLLREERIDTEHAKKVVNQIKKRDEE